MYTCSQNGEREDTVICGEKMNNLGILKGEYWFGLFSKNDMERVVVALKERKIYHLWVF